MKYQIITLDSLKWKKRAKLIGKVDSSLVFESFFGSNYSLTARTWGQMKSFIPELKRIPDRKVLAITTIGDPSHVGDGAFAALYGTAYGTKFKVYKPAGKAVIFGKLCALWPDAHLKPRDKWTGIWAVPVPDFYETKDLIQKDSENIIKLEVWPGGDYAQILHIGPYSEEGPTVQKLHDYIESLGYQMSDIPGTHEEEYLTSPDAKVVKTIIRYRLK